MNIHSDGRKAPAVPTETRDKTDRRQDILDAALVLFTERSFAATPVPKVADRAGVGTGTIYRYWDSKEALVNELYQRCRKAQATAMGAPPGRSAREEFGQWWTRMARFVADQPVAFEFLEAHKHQPYLDDDSVAMDVRLRAGFASFIERWQAAEQIVDLEPYALVTLAYGAFVGFHQAAIAGRLTLSADLARAAEDRAWKLFEPPTGLPATRS